MVAMAEHAEQSFHPLSPAPDVPCGSGSRCPARWGEGTGWRGSAIRYTYGECSFRLSPVIHQQRQRLVMGAEPGVMPIANRHILDNQTATVESYLRQALADADDFRCVSAYFTIHGYGLLADQLETVGRTRFLFGNPASVKELDPGEKEPKTFQLTESGLEPEHVLQQKDLAKRCTRWVSRNTVEIRAVSRANFLHGKLYLTTSPRGQAAVVGSSNFTRRGLGAGSQPNLEINLATEDEGTKDVKQKVLDALAHIGKDWQQLRSLADNVIQAKATSPAADTSALEAEIDRLVYQLYGLTEAEIATVEGSPTAPGGTP